MNPFSIEHGWQQAKGAYPIEHHDMIRHAFYGGVLWGGHCIFNGPASNREDEGRKLAAEARDAMHTFKPKKQNTPYEQN